MSVTYDLVGGNEVRGSTLVGNFFEAGVKSYEQGGSSYRSLVQFFRCLNKKQRLLLKQFQKKHENCYRLFEALLGETSEIALGTAIMTIVTASVGGAVPAVIAGGVTFSSSVLIGFIKNKSRKKEDEYDFGCELEYCI